MLHIPVEAQTAQVCCGRCHAVMARTARILDPRTARTFEFFRCAVCDSAASTRRHQSAPTWLDDFRRDLA